MSLYVEYRIHKMWQDIGCPKNMIIEVGGIMSDPEVEPIFAPMIHRLSNDGLCRTILLSELAYNCEHIKTKSLQDGVKKMRSHHATPWLIVAREPAETEKASLSERLEFERVISSNLYLQDEYTVTQSASLGLDITIPEGISSIEDNAIAKARAWSVATGKIAIGDDTGFFICELNGEPGVALRRWGGELPDNATGEEFWSYLRYKTEKIDSLDCYFNQCVAIASPQGEVSV